MISNVRGGSWRQEGDKWLETCLYAKKDATATTIRAPDSANGSVSVWNPFGCRVSVTADSEPPSLPRVPTARSQLKASVHSRLCFRGAEVFACFRQTEPLFSVKRYQQEQPDHWLTLE